MQTNVTGVHCFVKESIKIAISSYKGRADDNEDSVWICYISSYTISVVIRT